LNTSSVSRSKASGMKKYANLRFVMSQKAVVIVTMMLTALTVNLRSPDLPNMARVIKMFFYSIIF
jgi:hypothetical protein